MIWKLSPNVLTLTFTDNTVKFQSVGSDRQQPAGEESGYCDVQQVRPLHSWLMVTHHFLTFGLWGFVWDSSLWVFSFCFSPIPLRLLWVCNSPSQSPEVIVLCRIIWVPLSSPWQHCIEIQVFKDFQHQSESCNHNNYKTQKHSHVQMQTWLYLHIVAFKNTNPAPTPSKTPAKIQQIFRFNIFIFRFWLIVS